jgi:hypothetical protein
MMAEKDAKDALRRARNKGLREEQDRLSDPDHHTPEEDPGVPDPAPPREIADEDNGASEERLHNPPQVKGPREAENDMV